MPHHPLANLKRPDYRSFSFSFRSCSAYFTLVAFWSVDKISRDMTKPTKWLSAQRRLGLALGIHPVWSESSLSAWREYSEESDQTGRMPRLIWVFAGRTAILLVLSCRGSNMWHTASTDLNYEIISWNLVNTSFQNSSGYFVDWKPFGFFKRRFPQQ